MNVKENRTNRNLRVMRGEEIAIVSGGHPAIVAGAAIYGGYKFGEAVGKGVRKLKNWVKEKRDC